MNIVFDIGNVLIRWNLHAAFAGHFASAAETDAYLAEVGFSDWNRQQDGGRTWAEAVDDLRARHGERAHPAALYPERHRLTIAEPIEGTWDLAQRLAENGHALYAITNWSAESWRDALETHPRLADRFRDIVVSGREKMLKPDPAIYRLLIDRNGLAAADCLFIDDSAANVEGARAVGMDAVLFTDPAALERDLNDRWLL